MSYFSENLTLSKLQILYFLYLTNMEISSDQITRIALENDWDQYFGIVQSLAELSDTNLLAIVNRPHGQLYCITEQGKSAMAQFLPRLAQSKRTAIETYIKNNKIRIIQASQHFASYTVLNKNEFLVECKIVECDITLMSLTLNVVSRELAKDICDRWQNCAQNVYKNTLTELFKNQR